MSKWTYVRGTIKVNTYGGTDAEAMFMAQTVVDHLPRITGSEGDVDFYLIRPNGHSSASNVDEFMKRSNLYTDRYYKMFETQTEIIIVLDGNLRDRDLQTTIRETTKMLNRLSSKLDIESCLVNITDSFGNDFIFNNPGWVLMNATSRWAFDLIRHYDVTDEDKSIPEEMGLDKIAAIERLTIRHRDLNNLLDKYTQYLLSSKCNPNFEITSDKYLYDLINRIKSRKADLEQSIEETKTVLGLDHPDSSSIKLLADADALINRFDSMNNEVLSNE
ncbi:MAG: hypothetical protein NC548_42665 [Lachnospiraceae bacterium]|nr:hypothetical protein [Lachnospiraceae bacterium]